MMTLKQLMLHRLKFIHLFIYVSMYLSTPGGSNTRCKIYLYNSGPAGGGSTTNV